MPLPVPSPSKLPTPVKSATVAEGQEVDERTMRRVRRGSLSPAEIASPTPTTKHEGQEEARRAMPPPPIPSARRGSVKTKDAKEEGKGATTRRGLFSRPTRSGSVKEAPSSQPVTRSNSSASLAARKAAAEEREKSGGVLGGIGRTLRSTRSTPLGDGKVPERRSTISARGSAREAVAPAARERERAIPRPGTGQSTTSSTSTAARKPSISSTGGSLGRTHRRNASVPSTDADAPAASIPRPTTASSTASRKAKPEFTTLNQHYSPARPRQLPPRPSTAQPDAATTVAQTQLLQYTCLYASSHATYAQLTASATAKLKHRFETLAAQHSRSREQLAKRQRTASLTALKAVIDTPSAGVEQRERRKTIRGGEEKIQRFSEAITRLESVLANEQRELTRVFEDWITGYCPPSSFPPHTTASSTDSDSEDDFLVEDRRKWIDGLGLSWRNDCQRVLRMVEDALADIEAVVASIVRSGEEVGVVGVVAERWVEVARGVEEEVEGMWKLEGGVVGRERERLREVVGGIESRMRGRGEGGKARREEEMERVLGEWREV